MSCLVGVITLVGLPALWDWPQACPVALIYFLIYFRYPKRFLFAVIFCVINFGYATTVVLDKIKDPKRNVTHVVLNILAGNLIMYLIYYIIRKNCCKTTEAQFVEQDRYTIDCGKFKIHYTISAGSFFAIMALTFGIVAINFYTMRSANRNLTPAESRNLNSNCTLLDFYDNHDLWHFFSAAGIFMAFMALLTVDDDLLHVPRDKIDVF
jgi:predicted membrane channel-forming protein YqfA (hemolysin III family)